MMKHRYSPRVEGVLDVDISRRGRRVGRYRTRNLSFDGMFLETGPVNFQANDLLDLNLEAHGQSCSMRAVVVHRSHEGVGVMLPEDCLNYCRLILDAIDAGALEVPAKSAGIAYCRPVLEAIDRGALHAAGVRGHLDHRPA